MSHIVLEAARRCVGRTAKMLRKALDSQADWVLVVCADAEYCSIAANMLWGLAHVDSWAPGLWHDVVLVDGRKFEFVTASLFQTVVFGEGVGGKNPLVFTDPFVSEMKRAENYKLN